MSKFKNAVRVGLGALLATSIALTAVGCGGGDDIKVEYNDPEKRALVLSMNRPDEVYNPFFASSAVDSSLVSMTQVGLLSADKKGEIVCGENEPSVALDYSVNETKQGGETVSTTYQFIIKKDIKFSDGVPLTIKDVLFNLYVYLDPAYTGSATIYSTKIEGLSAYRAQKDGADDNAAEEMEKDIFIPNAKERRDKLISYVKSENINLLPADRPDKPQNYTDEQAKEDFDKVIETFRKELSADYNTVSGSMESYITNNKFDAAWQPFLMNWGVADLYKKNPDGSWWQDLNNNKNYCYDPDCDEAKDLMVDLEEYLDGVKEGDEGYADKVKEWAIERAFGNYITSNDMKRLAPTPFEMLMLYSGTAESILNYFTAVAKTEYFAQFGGNLAVPEIRGISSMKGEDFVPSKESNATADTADYSGYEMLQIKINGVDPKAIYNFAFAVAPMHYYGNENYVSEAGVPVGTFGVSFSDIKFMNDVIQGDKNNVPVGAGSYQATNRSGGDLYNAETKEIKSGFYDTGIAYFKRNDYFTTVGKGLDNAKIKYVRYQEIDSDQIITSLNGGYIDFGEPSATVTNEKLLGSNIEGETVMTNGYGYVGINAGFVPDINVRRAIMKAMDVDMIINEYYNGGYATPIFRSMSKENWAYPQDATTYRSKDNGTSYAFDPTGNEIQALLDTVLSKGYEPVNGIYTNGKDKLEYEFIIAGGSTDHPAYSMFLKAADILNKTCHGIKITVSTSRTALSDLVNGKLAVWAAAWISAIDPDMYQIYHKDSNASSTLNWGYKQIKNDFTQYNYERQIVTELSQYIDLGRSTTDQDDRKAYYAHALDLVMELAVELPTYQRKDLFAYNKTIIDGSTLQNGDNLTPNNGPLARIWEVNYYLDPAKD